MSKKTIILFTVFVDVLGLGIVIPVLPFYAKSFGLSDFAVTALFSVFSLFSFFSAPFLGAISDRIGRRPVLIASIVSSAIGWLIFAAAKSPLWLFAGRIIDGLAAGNFSTAQSYLVDISKDSKDRTANLGLIGAMFGIGLVIGPLIGGVLGAINHTLPFWTVGALAAINATLAYFRLPETLVKPKNLGKLNLNPLSPILRTLGNNALLPSLIAWFLFGTAIASQQSVFSLFLSRAFGFQEFVSGIFLTGTGVVLAINQGFLLKHFWIKKFKEPGLELFMFLALTAGFFLISSNVLWIFVGGLIILTISHSVLRIVMTSQIAGASGSRHGEVMGAMSSIMSVSMIIGPLVAGALFVNRISLPFLASGLLSAGAFLIIYISRKKISQIQPDESAAINSPI